MIYGPKTDKSDVTGDVPLSNGSSEPNHQGKRNTCWNREIGYSCLTFPVRNIHRTAAHNR
jgi:hypothetical protein